MMKKEPFVCSWRAGPVLTAAPRKLLHNPGRILAPHISKGMTVMDIGCGMGFFTIPMSGIAGENGKIIAVDLQQQMLDGLLINAAKTGMKNITAHRCAPDYLGVKSWNGSVDFALVFWMLHEVPDQERLIRELYDTLSKNGKLLFAEPYVHVSGRAFQNSLNMIIKCGFTAAYAPKIAMSRAALLCKL